MTSGTQLQGTYTWNAAGSSTFEVLAKDNRGQSSGWTSYQIYSSTSCVSTGTYRITGYAWSDSTGWIDLSCTNSGMCGTSNFGLWVDNSGNISGCAWSDSQGWISASPSDLTGCPNGTCTAVINSNGSFSGWLKTLSADGNGWDGWIGLRGTAGTSTYGVVDTSGNLSGYAWGQEVLGWINFGYASTTYSLCTPVNVCSGQNVVNSCTGATVQVCPYSCYAGACTVPSPSYVPTSGYTGQLQVKPNLLASGNATYAHWNVTNANACTVSGTNGDSWSGLASPATGATSSPILGQTVYTLSCTPLAGATSTGITGQATVNMAPVFHER